MTRVYDPDTHLPDPGDVRATTCDACGGECESPRQRTCDACHWGPQEDDDVGAQDDWDTPDDAGEPLP